VRDGSTASGWRIVDPRTVLGGGFAPQGGTSGTSGGGAAPMTLTQLMNALVTGQHVPGYN
jgi:hypothetical protein